MCQFFLELTNQSLNDFILSNPFHSHLCPSRSARADRAIGKGHLYRGLWAVTCGLWGECSHGALTTGLRNTSEVPIGIYGSNLGHFPFQEFLVVLFSNLVNIVPGCIDTLGYSHVVQCLEHFVAHCLFP